MIDSHQAGLDAGEVLDQRPNGIPICRDLADAVRATGEIPTDFIYGMAPASGMLSPHERTVVLQAIGLGMNIVSGLHEFLNDDAELASASAAMNVTITDVRRPRAKRDLRMFTGRIADVTCPRIAVLGTDAAIGKRTTSTILTQALRDRGINAVMVSTGQTGLIQGARYGVALDAVPAQFCAGEMEATVLDAFEQEHPDVIIVEGQGALSHPAYITSCYIIRGSRPDGIVLQHAPGRASRCDFDAMPMPTVASEIELVQMFSGSPVIGLTINHEAMTDSEVTAAISLYEAEFGVPVTDALTRPDGRLVEMILSRFPVLREKVAASVR